MPAGTNRDEAMEGAGLPVDRLLSELFWVRALGKSSLLSTSQGQRGWAGGGYQVLWPSLPEGGEGLVTGSPRVTLSMALPRRTQRAGLRRGLTPQPVPPSWLRPRTISPPVIRAL